MSIFNNKSSSVSSEGDLILYNLCCEYKKNPLGIGESVPRLSWKSSSGKRGVIQEAYRILVSTNEKKLAEDDGEIWDSGWVESEKSLNIPFGGKPAKSSTKYYWKVMIRDRDHRESGWSRIAFWTTAIVDQGWEGIWIGSSQYRPRKIPSLTALLRIPETVSILPTRKRFLPIFRKNFILNNSIRRAQVSICGLGQYELSVNGCKAGNNFLDPAWSVYEKTLYYNTFDITSLLVKGENTFGVMLGKGFYNTRGDRRTHAVYNDGELKLILQCSITYEDGSTVQVVSDRTWRTTEGPVSHSAILAGEDYDARRLPESWNRKGFDDSNWEEVLAAGIPSGELKPVQSLPMKELEIFKAAKIDTLPGGLYVYDFGQNASSIPRLRIRGRAGQKIRIKPAEQRHNQTKRTNNGTGKVNQAGVGLRNHYEYTLSGRDVEEWQPQFTYGGFQYLQVSGAVPSETANPNGLPVIESLESVHVRNEAPPAGSFECSNPLFNRIDEVIDRSVCSNLGHVLTDCPHREKLGWLETSYLMGPSISRRYDISRLYTKITGDIRDSREENGKIFTVAPNYPLFVGGFRYTPEWGAAGVILPWQLYKWYGDEQVLAENYSTMKGFVDYMESGAVDLVPVDGLGDWFDYGHGKTLGASKYTPTKLTAMATFYRCTTVLIQAALVLGKDEESRQYGDLAVRIKAGFNEKYFNGKDQYSNNGSPQTANAIALSTGISEDTYREDITGMIVKDMESRGYQQTSGDVGFYYLIDALAKAGLHDLIYENTNRREEGSYGFIIDRGWNSMPEAWNAHTGVSMNHCMLGHIQKWFYHDLLGIKQSEMSTGFKDIVICPAFPNKLDRVKGHYESVYGRIRVEWEKTDGNISLKTEIPSNTRAIVSIPAISLSGLRERGVSLDKAMGIKQRTLQNGRAHIRIGSGSYHFTSEI